MYCAPLCSMRACRREAVFSRMRMSQTSSRPSMSTVFSRGNSMVRSPISRTSLASTLALEESPATWVASSVSPHISSKTRTASCLPLTVIASRSRRLARWIAGSAFAVAPLVSICPALASPARRAAVLTPSPQKSSFSSSTRPKWKPMRMASFTPAVGGSEVMRCCISRAASEAASGLLNATISSSPIVLTTWPSRAVTISRSAPRQASMVFAAGLSPSSSYRAVLPLTSANRIARSLEMRVIAFGKVSHFPGPAYGPGPLAEQSMNATTKIAERKCYINGEFRAGAKQFAKINPVDGTVVAQVHEADRAMVDAAVRAAKAALKGPWGKMALQARVDLLRKVAEGIEKRFDDFLAAEVADTGKPVSLASHLDIPRGAANFRVFADIVRTYGTESYWLDTPDGKGAVNYAMRKPLGVVGVIAPWNLPLLLLTWKLAPALACGNCIVAKPSEETPSTATLLAEVMHEAGVPPGVYNVVHGFGPDSAGEFITMHPEVNGITFTGETATGAAIMKAVAPTVKPISFELGGKNPGIVFADANLDKAVDGLARSVFLNTGQVCLCTERVYVERPIFDEVAAGLAERAKALVLGFPQEKNTNMGPLISKQHREKVLSYYELAKKEGAKVVTGGGVPKFGDARDNGAWIQPTLWTGLPESARTVREEIFGPCAHLAPFDREEEAVAMANDTPYGLASTVFTRDLSRGHRVGQAMEVGISWVNCWFLRDLRTPFGGAKLSGIGREGGLHSLNFYSEPTNVCIKL